MSFGLLSVVQDVIVMDVHQDGERLTDDDWDPHRCVTVITAQKAPHEPGQRDLMVKGLSVIKSAMISYAAWCAGLTCAIIPMKAQSLNIRRGTLTRYCQDTKHQK